MDEVIALVSMVTLTRSEFPCTASSPRASSAGCDVNAASALPNAVPLSTVRLLIMDAPFFHSSGPYDAGVDGGSRWTAILTR